MAKSIKLKVITPSKLFYEGMIEMVIVRTFTGEEGFMANHSWATKLLDTGEMCIQEAGTKEFTIASLAGGFIDIKEDIVIYTDSAEWQQDIDTERAAKVKSDAEKWLTEHKDDEPENLEEARIIIAKQKSRLKVAAGGAHKKK